MIPYERIFLVPFQVAWRYIFSSQSADEARGWHGFRERLLRLKDVYASFFHHFFHPFIDL